MNSASKPRCARGTSCYHVRKLRSEKPAAVAHKGDFCEKCREELGGHGPSSTSPGKDRVIASIEMVFEQRPTPQRPDKAVLWDLFGLDPYNGGWKKYSDLGAVLMRLDAKTLRKLRDWLEEHKQEAIECYDKRRYKLLHEAVSLSTLPPDMSSSSEGQGTGLASGAVAYYTRRGTRRDLYLPIRVASRAEE